MVFSAPLVAALRWGTRKQPSSIRIQHVDRFDVLDFARSNGPGLVPASLVQRLALLAQYDDAERLVREGNLQAKAAVFVHRKELRFRLDLGVVEMGSDKRAETDSDCC